MKIIDKKWKEKTKLLLFTNDCLYRKFKKNLYANCFWKQDNFKKINHISVP